MHSYAKQKQKVSVSWIGEPHKTHISRKRMKKRLILFKFKISIKLVFPDDASRAIDIDELEEQGVLRVLCEDEGTFEAGVGPLVGVWVSIKYASKSVAKNCF